MNFTVDARYQDVVQNFVWPEQKEDSTLPISSSELDGLVQDVAKQIIGASQIRTQLSLPSLSHTILRITQDLDGKYSKDTPAKIEQASEKEKTILSHTFKALTKMFESVTAMDLKVATLVFGIHRVHDLATENIIPLSELSSQIEQMETALAELRTFRSRYSEQLIADAPESIRQIIANVDKNIEEQSQKLALLKETANKDEKFA